MTTKSEDAFHCAALRYNKTVCLFYCRFIAIPFGRKQSNLRLFSRSDAHYSRKQYKTSRAFSSDAMLCFVSRTAFRKRNSIRCETPAQKLISIDYSPSEANNQRLSPSELSLNTRELNSYGIQNKSIVSL